MSENASPGQKSQATIIPSEVIRLHGGMEGQHTAEVDDNEPEPQHQFGDERRSARSSLTDCGTEGSPP